jgi:acetyl-CoA acetyltransferase
MPQHSVVVVAPVRTAIGTFGGSLKEIPAPDLGAVAIKAAIARAGLDPNEVGTVVMGNVVQAGAKMNSARQAAIHAGLPVSVPAMTVNRVCGSGAQAIVSASHEIISGAVKTAVAGGMENMDLAPYLIARGRWGYRMGDGQLYDSMLRDGLNEWSAGRRSRPTMSTSSSGSRARPGGVLARNVSAAVKNTLRSDLYLTRLSKPAPRPLAHTPSPPALSRYAPARVHTPAAVAGVPG